MKTFATTPKAEEMRAYRRRLVAEGQRQFIAALPRETVAFIDEFKQRQGFAQPQPGVAAIDRTKEGSRPAVIDPETRKPALPGGLSKLVTGL